jgi:SAM-dependent methyltransferase
MEKLSKTIKDILVCPVTHASLHREQQDSCEFLVANNRRYPVVNGVPNMVPTPPPKQLVQQWRTWEQLQRQGATTYEMAPLLNLANREDDEPKKFANFMQANGLTLDVGCGPQEMKPAYISDAANLKYIGMDPLLGHQPKTFPFIQGIGEALPFPDMIFDNIIFHSSLDHMLDYRIALREAQRVLKKGGQVIISTDHIKGKVHEQGGSCKRWIGIIYKGIRQLIKGIPQMGFVPMAQYISAVMKLRVPDGAMDYFHLHFPHVEEIINELSELFFDGIRKKHFDGQIFIACRKS